MMKICFFGFLMMSILGCADTSSTKNTAVETTTSGTIRISVDESFQPVMIEQIKVFEASTS